MADRLFSGGAAFGVFPQMQPRRRLQDPEAAANVPLSVLRGYAAGTAGLPGDIEGLFRSGLSQVPTEFFTAFPALRAFGIGSSANPTPQFPTTEFYNEYLPGAELNQTPLGKAFTSAGNLLGGVGSTNIAGLGVKGAKATGQALGPTAGRMAEGYLQRQGLMPNIVPEAPKNLFVGPIEKPQAPVSELGFYSAAEQAALNLPRKSGTGESFLNDLMKGQDVKKDELSWMGLDDYLKGKPNVTRQEVQDFIASNRVDVREVRLGDKEVKLPSTIGLLKREEILNKYQPKLDALYAEDANYANLTPQRYEELGQEIRALERQRDVEADAAYVIPPLPQLTPTKYERYQLPGGENYREILLTLPIKQNLITRRNFRIENDNGVFRVMDESGILKSFKTADEAITYRAQETRDDINKIVQKSQQYQSSHFNEPNILAHMRVNDRVDADGKKMLLIEEVQSDWHQAGREKGYIGNYAKGDVKPYTPERAKAEFGLPNSDLFWYFEVPGNTLQIPKSRFGTQDEAMNYVLTEKKVNSEGVPDAPFKDTWHQLALKRALKYAADNGYDRVGLTTGKQQAERYNLAKQVDEIVVPMVNADGSRSVRIEPTEGGNIKLMVDSNGVVTGYGSGSTQFSGKKLNEVLGKEIADKVMNSQANARFSGLDLQVGGEGMKKYYDEIYPAFLAKQGKKYNAKTGETRIKTGQGIPGGAPVRYIDISPEMKGGVKKGQPLFTAAPIGGIGLGAGMQDNEMPEAVRQYMADPRYSDPFADPIR